MTPALTSCNYSIRSCLTTPRWEWTLYAVITAEWGLRIYYHQVVERIKHCSSITISQKSLEDAGASD